MRTLLRRLIAAFRFAWEAPARANARRQQIHMQKVLQAARDLLPESVVVDWVQAPPQAITWIYDEKASRGRWLSGKNSIEEYGIVWEWWPAPSFGATRKAKVEKTLGDVAMCEAASLQRCTPNAEEARLAPRRL